MSGLPLASLARNTKEREAGNAVAKKIEDTQENNSRRSGEGRRALYLNIGEEEHILIMLLSQGFRRPVESRKAASCDIAGWPAI